MNEILLSVIKNDEGCCKCKEANEKHKHEVLDIVERLDEHRHEERSLIEQSHPV
jgi:hypothetical protein